MPIQFNSFERGIAKNLEALPQTKQLIKKVYQYLNFSLYHKSYTSKSNYTLNEIRDGENETFFGYYDKSPLNLTNEYLIYQTSTYSTKNLPSEKFPVKVILYDFINGKIINEFESFTYNWQQGTKLQWISSYEFIYNSIDINGNYCSSIVDAKKNLIIKKLDFPIYDVYGSNALSINFDRLAKLRPDYGYRNHQNTIIDIDELDNDGIYKIDLQSNTRKLLLSLNELKNFQPSDILLANPNAVHKVNHILISPDGEYFIVLHRFFVNGRKYDRLVLSDMNAENLKILNDHEMVSHCCWYGNNHIISYMRRFKTGDKYYLINIENSVIIPIEINSKDSLGDGHPSVINDKLIFDTYPDKSRMKSLRLFDLKTLGLVFLGEFYESLTFYGETRCDLHPKWSFDGKKIFFDSVHTGKRHLYYINI
jgi:hypothetical protein